VYLNGELDKVIEFAVLANQLIQMDVIFDELISGDHIYFIIVSNIEDKNKSDNTSSFYSWQDEIKKTADNYNPYKNHMDEAKRFLGV
jgi:hypothetical protein